MSSPPPQPPLPYLQYAPPPAGTSGKAITSCILGAIALCSQFCSLCCVLGAPIQIPCSILAIVFGILALSDLRRAHPPLRGKQLALIGLISGSVSLLLFLVLIASILVGVLTGSVTTTSSYHFSTFPGTSTAPSTTIAPATTTSP